MLRSPFSKRAVTMCLEMSSFSPGITRSGMTHLEESGHEVTGDGLPPPERRVNSSGGRARESRDSLERDRKVRDPMFELVFEFVQGLLHCPSADQETGLP